LEKSFHISKVLSGIKNTSALRTLKVDEKVPVVDSAPVVDRTPAVDGAPAVAPVVDSAPAVDRAPVFDRTRVSSESSLLEAMVFKSFGRNSVASVHVLCALDDIEKGSNTARDQAKKQLVCFGMMVEPLLLEMLKKESAIEVREAFLSVLGSIGSPSLKDYLMELKSSDNESFRSMAIGLSRYLSTDESKSVVLPLLLDRDQTVRKRALDFVSWHRPSWARENIISMSDPVDGTPDWDVLEALIGFDPELARVRINVRLADVDPIGRRRALSLLKEVESSLASK
jgi:hypothetical protein